MGTNFFFFTKDKQAVQEYAPYSYELTDEPEFGYLIHAGKRSCGWIPLWQAHRNGISSVKEYKEAYDSGAFRIIDEYYNEYNWNKFDEQFIQFNGGISGVQKKEKLNNDPKSPFYDPHTPTYGPISHCSGPDCTYRFGWADIDYFKDPKGYEFTSHEFR